MTRTPGSADRNDLSPTASTADEGGQSSATRGRKAAGNRKAPRRRSRSKSPRMKMCWAVVTGTMRQVCLYDYAAREQADQRAQELTNKHKSPHFVVPVRVPLESEDS